MIMIIIYLHLFDLFSCETQKEMFGTISFSIHCNCMYKYAMKVNGDWGCQFFMFILEQTILLSYGKDSKGLIT